jgi:hypothetical protein
VVEMVVDRGVGGGELLQGLDVSEPRHRSFSSSERLMGVLGSIVEPAATHLASLDPDLFHCGTVGAQAVGYEGLGSAVALHRPLEEGQGSLAIPAFRGKHLEPIDAEGAAVIYTGGGGFAGLGPIAIRAYSWMNWLYPMPF